jgi:hypothetical protein
VLAGGHVIELRTQLQEACTIEPKRYSKTQQAQREGFAHCDNSSPSSDLSAFLRLSRFLLRGSVNFEHIGATANFKTKAKTREAEGMTSSSLSLCSVHHVCYCWDSLVAAFDDKSPDPLPSQMKGQKKLSVI